MRFELGPADEIPNTFNMWFTMQGNKEIHREYLVYDPLDFIGTVGGSLALFIGCSFYDFCRLAEKRFWKKQKKGRNDFEKEENIEIA